MKNFAYLLVSAAALFATTSCSKKDDASPSSGPKDYKVEYRISSTTAPKAYEIYYTNETGGKTKLNNVVLPATYSITFNTKVSDRVFLDASTDGTTVDNNVKVTILIDGKEVKTETGVGKSASASISYIF